MGARIIAMSSASSSARRRPDPTRYPVRDDMGEGSLQRFIAELLRPLVEAWLVSRGERAFVGADQYIYWEQYNPTKSVAPDVYVIPDHAPGANVGCWKTWESDAVPSFAFEIVSTDHGKDYLRSPPRYDELGVRELVLFDPEPGAAPDRVRWQVFRRTRRGLVRVVATDADRVRSVVLGCWLRAVGEGDAVRVRLASGMRGDELVPSDAERAAAASRDVEAERERAEAERERAEAEHGRADEERRRREHAEAELARLKERLRAEPRPRRR